MKKNCSESPSDSFCTMNQPCFCANIFLGCNINCRSFSRSATSAFLCSSKILSIISCIRNSLSWNDCYCFRCNSSSCCWNEIFGFSLRVFLFFSSVACFNMFSNSSSSISSVSLFSSDRLLSSGILSSKDSNKKMKNYYHIVNFVKAWILLPDITCGSVYSPYNLQLWSWRLYRKYTHQQMMPGINIQTCDIKDDDRLYKLVFEYYCSDLIKYQCVQRSKFVRKNLFKII